MMNKKGVGASEWIEQIPKIILTVVVMVGIFALISLFVNVKVNVTPIQREVLFSRILYSPDSIMLTDNFTGEVYPGLIDMNKFNNVTLDNSIKYSYERQIAAKLEIYDVEKQLVKTAYLNEVWFKRLEPLARAKIKGLSSAVIKSRTIPVVYRESGIDWPGYLRVEILTPLG
jgi:hypothetical protein